MPRKLHPRQLPSEARLAHVFEHLAHLDVLPQKLIDLLHGGPGAAGDAFAAAAVYDFVVRTLIHRHGADDDFPAHPVLVVPTAGRSLHVAERAATLRPLEPPPP